MKKSLYSVKGCVITLLMTLCSTWAMAQEPNLKFWKPADWEWKYTQVPSEPTAKGVVLCYTTYSYYDYKPGLGLIISSYVKKRYKVLTDDGKNIADTDITLRVGDTNADDDKLTSLKVITYNMVGDKVEKTKISKTNITEEKTSKYLKRIKIRPEQVKKGSIIEIEYVKQSPHYSHVDSWYPQDDVPTLYADYDITIPDWFRFSLDQTGSDQINVTKSGENINFIVGGETLQVICNRYKAKTTNLPSLKGDQWIWNELDYADKLSFEMNGVVIPGSTYESFTRSWEDICNILHSSSDFGGRLNASNPLKKEMESQGIMNMKTPSEKIEACMKLLQSKVKWNGNYALGGNSASSIMKKGEGDNADMNFILINMLKDAGIKARPIVMSTRKNGRLPLSHPSIEALSSFFVGANINDTSIVYVDCSMKNGMALPTNLITERACVIDEAPFWVYPSKTEKGTESYMLMGNLAADGTLSLQGRYDARDCQAPIEVASYKDAKDSTTYVDEKANKAGITFNKFNLKYTEGLNPKCQITMALTKKMDTTAENIYLSPFVFTFSKENPFKDEKRNLPVEFPFIYSYDYTINIALPEGYTIESIPQPLNMSSEDKSMRCKLVYQNAAGRLIMRCQVSINKQLYPITEYDILKNFIDQVTARNNDVVVLKKNN